jgi:hypothetical protein
MAYVAGSNERSTHITEPGTLNYTADGVSKGVHYAPVAAQQSSTVRNTAESSASIEDSEANVFVAGSLALDLSCDYTIQPSGRESSFTRNPFPSISLLPVLRSNERYF